MSTDTSPAAVEAMCKMLLDKGPNGGHFVQFGPEAAAMLREWCARAIAAEAEAAMLRRERDEARDQFDHHVVWASDQSAKLEAEAAALREALREIASKRCESTTGEDHSRAIWIARAALKEDHDGL